MASQTTVTDGATIVATTESLAEFIRTKPTERLIDEFVDQLAKTAPQALPVLVARAVPIRKVLQYIEKVAEARIASDHIILFGQTWTDPEDGVVYEFASEPRERRVGDPAGLRDALLRAGAPKDQVARAIYDVAKINFVELNNLARTEEWREIIADFEAERGFGPAHLKEAK